jgi:hypothetical protein
MHTSGARSLAALTTYRKLPLLFLPKKRQWRDPLRLAVLPSTGD